ncbi:MAG: DUF2520 domain-containing protein [Acidimicrobiia bacterium]|nr:DUF2520 domain-containing protein [Acidimicrobiia bacterium]
MTTNSSVRIIGPGRAGGALAIALARVGWTVVAPVHRGESLSAAASGVDLLVIATPDGVIADVAREITPDPTTVVVHLSGALGLEALATHPQRASLHPLTSMPTAEIGAERLVGGAWFAIDANTESALKCMESLADALGGRSFVVDDEHRVAYHAAAAIASNHVVALLGSAERVARSAGVPIEAYLELVRATIDNIEDLGVIDALTGPVARGDWDTVARHRDAIDPSELALYDALVDAARRVVDSRPIPSDESTPPIPETEN